MDTSYIDKASINKRRITVAYSNPPQSLINFLYSCACCPVNCCRCPDAFCILVQYIIINVSQFLGLADCRTSGSLYPFICQGFLACNLNFCNIFVLDFSFCTSAHIATLSSQCICACR